MNLQILAIALMMLPSCAVVHFTRHDVDASLVSGAKVIDGVRPEVTFLSADESSFGQTMYFYFSPVIVAQDGRSFHLSAELMWKNVPERESSGFGRLRPTGAEEWRTPPAGIEAKINSVVLIKNDGSRHSIPLVVKSKTPGGNATTWQRLHRDGIEYRSAKKQTFKGEEDRWLEVTTSVRRNGGTVKTLKQRWKLKKTTTREMDAGIKSA